MNRPWSGKAFELLDMSRYVSCSSVVGLIETGAPFTRQCAPRHPVQLGIKLRERAPMRGGIATVRGFDERREVRFSHRAPLNSGPLRRFENTRTPGAAATTMSP
jgi:hypothetical protein